MDAPAGEDRALCVLVVEDNLEVGRFCTQLLEDLGHATVWAHNAEAALAEMEKVPFRFDAVFSDVVMPGMGGVELARHLEIDRREVDEGAARAHPRQQAVVVFTGSVKGLNVGAPLTLRGVMDELRQALSDVLERIRLISGIRSTETNIHLATYR